MKETPINTLVSILRKLSMFLGLTFFFIILVVKWTRCRYIYRCMSCCVRVNVCVRIACVRLSVYGSPYARVDVCKRVLLSACMCVCAYMFRCIRVTVCCCVCEWKCVLLSSPQWMRKCIRVRRCVQVSGWTNVAVCVCACVCKCLCALSVCMYACVTVFVCLLPCACVCVSLLLWRLGYLFFFK